MQWRTQIIGDTRERTIFAFLPHECDDGQTRWLCRLKITEKYVTLGPRMGEYWLGWVTVSTEVPHD